MRHTTTVVLLAAGLVLAGCSNSGSSDDAKPAASSPSADPGDTFISSVIDAHLDSYADGVPAVPPAVELKVFPPKWCAALDAGHSVGWMLDGEELYPVGETWGTEKKDAYQLVLLGVRAYCPKRTAQVKAELRDLGAY
ncbi:hypothetical protein ACWEPZ_37825 [Streptomyces sp. NPDC004288]|uniref:hypothetical protein n=1 Tax=Streptomyces sp. NPDC005574 TaxID=3156891 RepID=UPI0033BDDEF9